MNHQQARIEAHLDGLRDIQNDEGWGGGRTVDLVNQTKLLAEGYDLRALDHDLND